MIDFVADHLRVGVRHLHDDEAALAPAAALGECRRPTGEIGLGEIDEAVKPSQPGV